MSDPERWLTSNDAPGGMKDMLSAAQKVAPSTLERAALAGKIGVAGTGLWVTPALLKGLAAGAVVAGGVWIAASVGGATEAAGPATHPTPAATAPASHAQTPPAEEAPALQKLEAPNIEDSNPEGTALEGSQLPAAQLPAAKVPAVPPVKTAPVAKRSETSLIAQARNSLDSSPKIALGLLAEHAKLYPSGVLAEEREVLRIRALKNLGRAQDAQLEEQKFHQEHPESVHHVP